ncbi:hypothetical protein AC27_1720 [Escherichia coli 1-182-04_S3_C2]|nr:hypothetical protein AC27_1720 [Escherichia coli 1-182-04_S3_C2]
MKCILHILLTISFFRPSVYGRFLIELLNCYKFTPVCRLVKKLKN